MKILAAVVAFTVGLACDAQNLQEAVKKTMNERYENAATDFMALRTQQPDNAEVIFYAADNYLYWDEPDSARNLLSRGLAAKPDNVWLLTGMGRLEFAVGNTAKGHEYFEKVCTALAVKTPPVDKAAQQVLYIKMAESLIHAEPKELKKADTFIQTALKLNASNPEVYIQWGDMLLEGEAMNRAPVIAQYEKAYATDAKYTRALLRQGQLWARVENYELAEEWFRKAIANDQTFAPAYRELAEVLYKNKRTKEAKEMYEKYLALNDSPSARGRYLRFLYVLKEYKSVTEEGEKLLARDSSDSKVLRLCGYAAFETGDYPKGISYMERFFARQKRDGKPELLHYDYAYYGKLLSKSNQDSLAAINIEKAISMKPEDLPLYSDAAAIYTKMKKYNEAVSNYEKKIALSKKPEALDRSGLGQVYFKMAEAIREPERLAERNALFEKADGQFALITDVYPIFGNMWRGKVNSKLDNQEAPQGLAKPYYEAAIVKASTDATSIEKNKKDLVEAYSYLGFLYYTQRNLSCSKAAWLKVQELDAASEKAKAALSDKEIAAAPADCVLIAPR